MKNLDKYRGCLIGGAAGDALGYAVEFWEDSSIFQRYGENGITEYALINGIAEISDDTQMTLFTANGLLLGTTRGMTRGIMGRYPDYIASCYQEWLRTQIEEYPLNEKYPYSWLINIPELFSRRAPGNTCLSAVASICRGTKGTIESPINNSKGCGGIMRVAPIGLYFEGKRYTPDEIDMIGAETAALTHGHELGYIPAAALVHIINIISHNDDASLLDAVRDAMAAMPRLFPNAEHLDELCLLMQKAIDLSKSNLDNLDAIRELGEGWVAEETLAIAIYCSLKYEDNFDKALITAVNHRGDSDSTGAVTGNLLGAYLGMGAIPEKYITNLELRDVILEIADDLFNDCKITEYGSYRDEIWESKYIYKTYKPSIRDEDGRHEKSDAIILFPEYTKTKEEVEKLRTELSMLLLEQDELTYVICKNIETKYLLALGGLEYKAYELHCAVLRLKRKTELIQARKNRQERIILAEIETILDGEFFAYQKKLDEQINRMNAALERNKGKFLSEDEAKELKKLYHSIVKSLHPDLHPDITPAQIHLFHNAVSAYENGDLDALRIISEMIASPVLPDHNENGLTVLVKDKERLKALVKTVRDRIDEIKSGYPYILKSIIQSPERIAEKKAELEDTIAQLQETLTIYQAKIDGMMG